MRLSSASAALLAVHRLFSHATMVAAAVEHVGDHDESSKQGQQHAQHRGLQTVVRAVPAQTYYIPLPEADMNSVFMNIRNSATSFVDIVSLTSIAAAATGTVIWYDHWEDGFETDIANPVQPTTKVFGDGIASNGCVEEILETMKQSNPSWTFDCTGATDIITRGQALLLKNGQGSTSIPVPADPTLYGVDGRNEVYYDGGDLVRSSFPIALTRGGHPDPSPGALLAGAVEIVEAENYGTSFTSPVGTDTLDANGGTSRAHFQLTELHIMARLDNTQLYLDGTYLGRINRGQSYVLEEVQRGAQLTASGPVQVDLLTGDVDSSWELRWYSLLPTNKWSNKYYTPMRSDGSGKETFVLLFNPNPSPITITERTEGMSVVSSSISVPAGQETYVTLADQPRGYEFESNGGENFFALTVTDPGQLYDWGHPLIPADLLTNQALVGWGYGCTDNQCGGSFNSGGVRSVVWVTPVADATIYVDRDGDDQADSNSPSTVTERGTFTLSALEQVILTDGTDDDMTGAVIWAEDTNGDPVDIAVVWGQKPDYSGSSDDYALDMGTAIMPLPDLAAYKDWVHHDDVDGSGDVSPGDILRYIITITNTGRVNLEAGNFRIEDDFAPLHDQATYVPGSAIYIDHTDAQSVIPDDASGTAFPLDGAGYNNPTILPRDERHLIEFLVEIHDVVGPPALTLDYVHNTGRLIHNIAQLTDTFETITPINFVASVDLQTTVYGGYDGGAACTVDSAHAELYQATEGAPVTYCFVITNTGGTYLDEFALTDDMMGCTFTGLTSLHLAPGEQAAFHCETTVPSELTTNTGTVTAVPTLQDPNYHVNGGTDVTDIDPAGTEPVISMPPTFSPTATPLTGIDIANIDECKNFSQYFFSLTEIEHFAFLAHTLSCVRARVYYNDRPLTQDEVDESTLDPDWTIMCDSIVQGKGESEHTYIPANDCEMLTVGPAERIHFYVAMEYISDSMCSGLGGGGAPTVVGHEIASIQTVFQEVCPAI